MSKAASAAAGGAAEPDAKRMQSILAKYLTRGIPALTDLPAMAVLTSTVPHAPKRTPQLTSDEFKLAIANHLRYFPSSMHAVLAKEFSDELTTDGHIYMRRFRPTEYVMRAYPIDWYPAKCRHAAAIMHMIMNNLDSRVAQYPEELITYGGNGSVFSNWIQYHLLMKYLSEMSDHQTISMYSGHPMGLFPSHPDAPRVVVTNGMVIPNYSKHSDYDKYYALGVSMYGQMTAGSYAYIGPQGIVHGTTITILNAGRKYLHSNDLAGKVYVSSGLGGMSGAQGKAAVICGAVAVIAEVDETALNKRFAQGWVNEVVKTLDECITRIRSARAAKKPLAIAFHGNIVSLWERLAQEKDQLVELGSDQTSLHNPFGGGYYPVQLTYDESKSLMASDPVAFKIAVQQSLRRHVAAINKLVTTKNLKFWDYGNSFLLEASRASADIMKPLPNPSAAAAAGDSKSDSKQPQQQQQQYSTTEFRYPSYVQEFMGDVFSLGFGPFRWVCTSADPADLATTDAIATSVIKSLRGKTSADHALERVDHQYRDNQLWIEQASTNQLVVGSQARILYADATGRTEIALAFNAAIKSGKIKGPIVLSRDHHDVSGTDSPYRETSNVYDGSMFCADMAIQNVIGDSYRGATWVSIHNGGGVGWGEVINGGFGLVLDGSEDSARRAKQMLFWDVNNGVARRAWAGNDNAKFAVARAMTGNSDLKLTVATVADPKLIASLHVPDSASDKRKAESAAAGGGGDGEDGSNGNGEKPLKRTRSKK